MAPPGGILVQLLLLLSFQHGEVLSGIVLLKAVAYLVLRPAWLQR